MISNNGSSEVVVMPTYARPEMLALALEALDRTQADVDVRIFADHGANLDEIDYVRDTYYPHAVIFHAAQHIYAPSGMWNILHALKAGYDTGALHIYIVEEDVLVHPDFFKWHHEAQADAGDFIATCGRIQPRYPDYRLYQNPGSCFRRDKLALVVKHIKDELFADPRGYQDRTFGPMDESSHLDDGLVRRVARQHGLGAKYPETPKCRHIGFAGYNRIHIFQNRGNIQERIEGLRKMLPTIDPSGRYSRDFE
ncbi:Uncharacterised protein [uncultured archaeon]|nr:Uncharacterised protein [uncultured archaeon]